MNISEIKELIQLVNETEIGELEIESEDVRLVLRKTGGFISGGCYTTIPVPEPPLVHHTPVTAVSNTPTPVEPQREIKHGKTVKSPMVGTFYRASRPGADPFVQLGDRVKTGQTLCIIEAMKLMNEIETEFTGKVVDILVDDGQPVEYGQDLFIIDPEQ